MQQDFAPSRCHHLESTLASSIQGTLAGSAHREDCHSCLYSVAGMRTLIRQYSVLQGEPQFVHCTEAPGLPIS
jgi:hypothetical protein